MRRYVVSDPHRVIARLDHGLTGQSIPDRRLLDRPVKPGNDPDEMNLERR